MFKVYVGRLIGYDFESITMKTSMHAADSAHCEIMHCQHCVMHDIEGKHYAGAMSYKDDKHYNCIQNWEIGTPCILIRRNAEVDVLFDTLDNFKRVYKVHGVEVGKGGTFTNIEYDGMKIRLIGDEEAIDLIGLDS